MNVIQLRKQLSKKEHSEPTKTDETAKKATEKTETEADFIAMPAVHII